MTIGKQSKFNTIVNNLLSNGWSVEELKHYMRLYIDDMTNEVVVNNDYTCNDNLAIFSKSITNIKDIGSSILFFTTNDEVNDDSLICRCILCQESLKVKIGSSVDISSLKRHINRHGNIGNAITAYYPKMGNLLRDVQLDTLSKRKVNSKRECDIPISGFFRPSPNRKPILPSVSEISGNDGDDGDDGDDEKIPNLFGCPQRSNYSIITGLTHVDVDLYKKILRTVALGIPLTWNRKLNSVDKSITKDLLKYICAYDTMKNHLEEFCVFTQSHVAKYLQQFEWVNFCCDGWSVVKPNISMDCVFACTFHNNVFRSVLCKCFTMESATADNIRNSMKGLDLQW